MIEVLNKEYAERNDIVISEMNNLTKSQREMIIVGWDSLRDAYYRTKRLKFHRKIHRMSRNYLFDCTPKSISLKPYMSIDILKEILEKGLSKTKKSAEHPNGRTALVPELFQLQTNGHINFLDDELGVIEFYKFLQRRVFTMYLTSKQNNALANYIEQHKCSVITAYEELNIRLVQIGWKRLRQRGNPKVPFIIKNVTIKEMLEDVDNAEQYKYDKEIFSGEKSTKKGFKKESRTKEIRTV